MLKSASGFKILKSHCQLPYDKKVINQCCGSNWLCQILSMRAMPIVLLKYMKLLLYQQQKIIFGAKLTLYLHWLVLYLFLNLTYFHVPHYYKYKLNFFQPHFTPRTPVFSLSGKVAIITPSIFCSILTQDKEHHQSGDFQCLFCNIEIEQDRAHYWSCSNGLDICVIVIDTFLCTVS